MVIKTSKQGAITVVEDTISFFNYSCDLCGDSWNDHVKYEVEYNIPNLKRWGTSRIIKLCGDCFIDANVGKATKVKL